MHEDPKKNYGVGSVTALMALVGEKGANTFSFSTGIYLPETLDWWANTGRSSFGMISRSLMGMGYDVGYHSPKPLYEDQHKRDNCDFLDGKPCYGDGSALQAKKWFEILITKGSDEIWKMLEEEYKETFEKE